MRIPLLILAVAVSACGAKSSTDDPLTGTWSNTTCYQQTGLPDNVESCATSLTFTADLKFTLVYTEQAPPASAVTPRCLTTHKVTGQTWSEGIKNNAQTLSLAGAGKATVSVTGCVHDSDNKGETTDTATSVAPGDMVYAINANGQFGSGWATSMSSYLIDFGTVGTIVFLFVMGVYSGYAWRRALAFDSFYTVVIGLLVLINAVYMPLVPAVSDTNLLFLWLFCLIMHHRPYRYLLPVKRTVVAAE